MFQSLKTPELTKLAAALDWHPKELEERIFELGLATLSAEAHRLAETPCSDPTVICLTQPEARLVHWIVAASNLLQWQEEL